MPVLSATMALLTLLALGATAPPTERAADPPSGAIVEVDPEHASLGQVYRVLPPGRTPHIAFVSEAPLERFVGECEIASGYAVVRGLADLAALVVAAPVEGITTGIPMRDEHLASGRWLDAGEHPNIVFRLAAARGLTEINAERRFTTLVGDLVGDLTIAGVTCEIVAPATLVFMPESDATRAEAPGNLLAVRAAFDVRLDDFSIGAGDPARRTGAVAETIRVQVRLLLSDSDTLAAPGHAPGTGESPRRGE